jgi:hypothetical protein
VIEEGVNITGVVEVHQSTGRTGLHGDTTPSDSSQNHERDQAISTGHFLSSLSSTRLEHFPQTDV